MCYYDVEMLNLFGDEVLVLFEVLVVDGVLIFYGKCDVKFGCKMGYLVRWWI